MSGKLFMVKDPRSDNPIDYCGTCGFYFDEVEVLYQSLKNQRMCAVKDDDGNVMQECCDGCAQEIYDAVGWR